MKAKETIIKEIREAFSENEYPGDAYLQDSFDGCEPYDEVNPFKGKQVWSSIESDFLDAHAAALSFFSEAGFRFFIPAYLIADMRGELKISEPVFYLTNGFYDLKVEIRKSGRLFVIESGRSAFINPRRYGSMTFYDYARYRLSVFTREEAAAIVAYLEYKRDSDESGLERERIEAALDSFWMERVEKAPSSEDLRRHLADKEDFIKLSIDTDETPLS